MNSFELMKAIVCCDEKLKKTNVCLYYDVPKKISIGIEYKTKEDNKPLLFRVKVMSPKSDVEKLSCTYEDLMKLHNSVIDIAIKEKDYRVNLRFFNVDDGGVNETQQQTIIIQTELTVYERK